MTTEQIRPLLDRYFEGETTLEEEQQLRTWFHSEDLPADLLPFRPLFLHFEKEQTEGLSSDFEKRLLEKLDPKPETPVRRLFPMVWRVAAAVLMAFTAGYLGYMLPQWQQSQPVAGQIDWEKYEIDDPELALEETKEALLLLSEKLNRSANKATKELKKVEKVSVIFE